MIGQSGKGGCASGCQAWGLRKARSLCRCDGRGGTGEGEERVYSSDLGLDRVTEGLDHRDLAGRTPHHPPHNIQTPQHLPQIRFNHGTREEWVKGQCTKQASLA
jgi:hypothetical protein